MILKIFWIINITELKKFTDKMHLGTRFQNMTSNKTLLGHTYSMVGHTSSVVRRTKLMVRLHPFPLKVRVVLVMGNLDGLLGQCGPFSQ